VVWNEEERARRGNELFEVGRGGDVTFHGPGQLVGYPIIKLEGAERRAVWYVSQLEQVLIRTLAAFGIQAGVDPCNRGVWVGPDKIAALGVRIAGHVTLHGFALNVAADLRYYEGIVPCGIRDRGVTSIHRFVPEVTMADVKARLLDIFTKVFGYQTWKQVDYND
jgi:lipoate-protein ligase B